jgi:hypothetical protein
MSDIWEPWQPVIGQRVQVRLNGECPDCADLLDLGWNGERGIVQDVFNENFCNGHRYGVATTERYAIVAAIELEPER